jgi:hypothetical protein
MIQWKHVGALTAIIAATMIGGTTTVRAASDRPPSLETQPQDQPEKIDPPLRPGQQQTEVPRAPDEKGAPTNGVIHPPETGDKSVLTPPKADRAPMPELKPPGSPGGNPNVQPK